MTTKIEHRAGRSGSLLSADLRRSLGEAGLLRLALDAVQALDPHRFDLEGRRAVGLRPQMMLTLLTYCYAAAIYGSRDIACAIAQDRTVRYICAHTLPDWQTIRRFRRQLRSPLHQCLVWVMKQAWALQFDEGEADYVGYEWFESEFLEQINAASLERLDIAALTDEAQSD